MMLPMKGLRQAAIALALCSGAAGARAATPAVPPAVAQALRCTPGAACAAKIPVKVVIVTMFEVGQDTGDVPGEFQFWRERRKLDVRIPFPQSHHDLYYNPQSQILGMVTGMGSIRSATATLALGLDQRFDLSHAYWLVAGIAGVDPHQATIGSAVWAHYLVDGDLAHEIDAREIPADWKSGYFALHSNGPGDKRPQQADEGEDDRDAHKPERQILATRQKQLRCHRKTSITRFSSPVAIASMRACRLGKVSAWT